MASSVNMLGPGPAFRLLPLFAVLLLQAGQMSEGRYFGPMYQAQEQLENRGLPAVVPDGLIDLDDGSAIPISALESLVQEPIGESEELGAANEPLQVNKMLYVSNHAQEDPEWSKLSGPTLASLGQVAGVAASQDFLYAFHRGNVKWNDSSFNDETNVYNHQKQPIPVDTVVALDLVTGEIMFSWGKNSFYMPHGISVDPQGNIWLTDVALHQAFRYKKANFESPDLVLGERFVPGSDDAHFCKPTDVAIASSGVIYIADGYCNSRVVIFSASGKYLAEIGHKDKMQIPHSISLLEVEDLLCVADRENGRILCYNAGLTSYRQAGQLLFEVQHEDMHKLYAIAHIGDVILALNGRASSRGVSLDLATEQVVDSWSPQNDTFHEAHDLTVSHDGRSFYVCQFGPAAPSGPVKKVIKFDMIESTPKFMN